MRADFPGQIDLFTSFWLSAHWVWERRGTAKAAGLPFAEETITDTVLLDLATQNPSEIRIFPFNKHREGQSGADWEWCFYDLESLAFLPILVQAKLLDDKEREYSHIDRVIGSTGVRQIDKLLSTAARRRIPAIYVFYNHLRDENKIPQHVCVSYQCVECWGCSVALAEAVSRSLPVKSFDSLKIHSKPWVCLLCRYKGNNAATRVLSALRELYENSRRVFRERDISFENVIPPPEQPDSEAPPYFRDLVELEERDPAEAERILARIEAENPNIDGIVLATDSGMEPEARSPRHHRR